MKYVMTKTERDKAIIISLVRKFGQLSRIEIRNLTHWKSSTISILVRELQEEGKLLNYGLSDNLTGRRRVLLSINPKCGFVVGVALDDRIVQAAVMDLSAGIIDTTQETTCIDKGVDGLVEQLLGCTRRAIQQAGVKPDSILGIGFADSSLIDSRQGISMYSSVIECWREVPVKKIFETEFGVPLLLENYTRAKTVAEAKMGPVDLVGDMIYIDCGGALSAGISAGIMVDGKILRGRRECAGEFGHIPIIERGPACKCGSFGCLEAVDGGVALASKVRKAILEGSKSQVVALVPGGDLDKITGLTVLQAAKLGDKTCLAFVAELGEHLGLGLATLVNLFNPSLIVLDQCMGMAGKDLLEGIIRIVKMRALTRSTEDLVFQIGKLGIEGAAVGAGLVVLEDLFEVPMFRPPRYLIEQDEAATAPQAATAAGYPQDLRETAP